MQPKLYVVVSALSLCGSVVLAQAQGQTSPAPRGGSAPAPSVQSTSPTHTKEMDRLLEAAQKLRDATHELAQRAPTAQRNEAIRQANEAVLDTQRAMLDLPADMRTNADPKIGESEAMRRLEEAAQRLREAVQAMAAEQAGPRRNAAIKQANEALFETQQTMVDILPRAGNASR